MAGRSSKPPAAPIISGWGAPGTLYGRRRLLTSAQYAEIRRKPADLHTKLWQMALEGMAGYRELIKAYIKYANEYFRHATSEAQPRPQISMREAESFVYLTGVFLRLAMPQVSTEK
jgi:hypothetical protein